MPMPGGELTFGDQTIGEVRGDNPLTLYLKVGVVFSMTLPQASGGRPPYDYFITNDYDLRIYTGLSFDPATRILSGVPRQVVASRLFNYSVTDTPDDFFQFNIARIPFHISVLPDNMPEFARGASIDDIYATVDVAVDVALPEATGGDGALTYTIAPALPSGLVFSAADRTITGSVSVAVDAAEHTYTVTDADGDSAELTFSVSVSEAGPVFSAANFPERFQVQSTYPRSGDRISSTSSTIIRNDSLSNSDTVVYDARGFPLHLGVYAIAVIGYRVEDFAGREAAQAMNREAGGARHCWLSNASTGDEYNLFYYANPQAAGLRNWLALNPVNEDPADQWAWIWNSERLPSLDGFVLNFSNVRNS